ncbi:MAG: YbhN family protein [Acidimicrobiales bacterium]
MNQRRPDRGVETQASQAARPAAARAAQLDGGNRPGPPTPTVAVRGPLARAALGVGVGVLLVYAAVRLSGGLHDAARQLGRAQVWWLAPALGAQSATYWLLAAQLRRLSRLHRPLSWSVATRLALVVFGLGSVLPASPTGGIALAVSELRRRGTAAGHATLVVVCAEWAQFWALVVIGCVGGLAAAALGDLPAGIAPGVAGVAAGVVVLAGGAAAAARRYPIAGWVADAARWAPGLRARDATHRRAAIVRWHQDATAMLGAGRARLQGWAIAAGAWLGDIACLWLALKAVGTPVSIDVVVVAYIAGACAGLLPLLPGGLGGVEIAVPAVLHQVGVPLVAALGATVLWRAVSLLAPAVAGLGAWISLRARPVGAPPPDRDRR